MPKFADQFLRIPDIELSGRLGELEPHKETMIVTVCKGGGRAHTAGQILMQALGSRAQA